MGSETGCSPRPREKEGHAVTFTDLHVDDLSGGRSLHQDGHLTGPAIDVATVLLEFIDRVGRP